MGAGIILPVGPCEMIAGVLNIAGLRLERPIEAGRQAFHRRIAVLPVR